MALTAIGYGGCAAILGFEDGKARDSAGDAGASGGPTGAGGAGGAGGATASSGGSGGGDLNWLRRFGSGAAATMSLAVDSDGGILTTGYFADKIDFGGAVLQSAGDFDVFVARLDPMGGQVWSARYGDSAAQIRSFVARGMGGRAIIAGDFSGTIDFGGDVLVGADATPLFLASFDAEGIHLSSRDLGGSQAVAVAANAAGDVALLGYCNGTANAGGSDIDCQQQHFLVAVYDSAGVHAWSRAIGTAGTALDIAIDDDGGVVLGGYFGAAAMFDAVTLTPAGGLDGFVVKLSAAGSVAWSAEFGGASDDYVFAVDVDADGRVAVAGTFSDSATLAGQVWRSGGSGYVHRDAFLAVLDAGGPLMWSVPIGAAGGQEATAVAFDASGAVLGAGTFSGGALSRDRPQCTSGVSSISLFVTKYDASGQHVETRCASSDSGHHEVRGVAASPMGTVIVGGYFIGAMSFEGFQIEAEGGNDDVFVGSYLE